MHNIKNTCETLQNTKDRTKKDLLVRNLHQAVEETIQHKLPAPMPGSKALDVEICWDFTDMDFIWDWTKHKITARSAKQLIRLLGMKTCKEKKAKAFLVIGEQFEGAFVTDKMKGYWLRPASNNTAAKNTSR